MSLEMCIVLALTTCIIMMRANENSQIRNQCSKSSLFLEDDNGPICTFEYR